MSHRVNIFESRKCSTFSNCFDCLQIPTESDSESVNSKSTVVDPVKSKQIFIQYFDTTCDLCSADLKSLRRANTHYRNEHKMEDGYIKCCGLKIKKDSHVNDHIRWHINPDIFK